MSIIPLTLPPGVYRNGTPYDAKNRWNDSNLIRWHDSSMRAIGGWERRAQQAGAAIPPLVADPETETIRDCITYRSNDGQQRMLFGSNANLYAVDSSGNVLTVTPEGFVGGANKPTNTTGYGTGQYGTHTYGTPRNPSDAEVVPVRRWTFSMWGENVICMYETGSLYEYAPDTPLALPIANAPSGIQSGIVTDERIVMTLSNTGDDIRMAEWSDRENNTEWTPTVTNYAGYYRMQGVGDAVSIHSVQDQYLILSETNAVSVRYIGAPFVYSFREVGSGCAPLHYKAVASTERGLVWVGLRNFWIFDGTLKVLPCDVMDFLASDVDLKSVSTMWATTITSYSEIWWFYKSTTDTDVGSYVHFNYLTGAWAIGKLARTVGSDRGALDSPVMLTAEGEIYNHEQSAIIPTGGKMFAKTGPLELSRGETNMAVRYIFPDTQTPNEVAYALYARQMPTALDVKFGPYTYNNPISTTGVLGREIRLEVEGLTNTWEVGGTTRFDVQPTQPKGFPSR